MKDKKKEPNTSEVKDPIKDSLKIQKLNEKLDSLLIDNSKKLLPPPLAWGIIEKHKSMRILGTLGNFSLIIGKAKSRKTFFIGIAVACAISNDDIFKKFRSQLPSKKNEVLYFDTEQGKYHVQLALKRICTLSKIENPTNLKVYGLRSSRPKERLKLIEHAIYNNPKVGFVVIDGIKDLVTSINSEEEATSIASDLLKWTEERGIHIVCVLHQNKSDFNARGHIGTELVNKAETVLSVSKAENDKNLSLVEAVQARNKEPEPFAFEIDNQGLPRLVEDFAFRVETKSSQKNDLMSITDTEQIDLLYEVFKNEESYSYSELVRRLKIKSTKKFNKNIGDGKIKTFITSCKEKKWLTQEKKRGPYNLNQNPSFNKNIDEPDLDDIPF